MWISFDFSYSSNMFINKCCKINYSNNSEWPVRYGRINLQSPEIYFTFSFASGDGKNVKKTRYMQTHTHSYHIVELDNKFHYRLCQPNNRERQKNTHIRKWSQLIFRYRFFVARLMQKNEMFVYDAWKTPAVTQINWFLSHKQWQREK